EPSVRRMDWQRRTLADFLSQVRWVKGLAELTPIAGGSTSNPSQRTERGIIFSNELLDSLPVHRLGWDAKRFACFEWRVSVSDGRFGWTRLAEEHSELLRAWATLRVTPEVRDAAGIAVPDWPVDLLSALPDGFILDICPAANKWWAEAAGVLKAGKLLT